MSSTRVSRKKSLSPIKWPKTMQKRVLKRHISTPSPERYDNNNCHQKKRCSKPVWATAAGSSSEDTTDEYNGYSTIKSTLAEPPCVKDEPDMLTPYQIQPRRKEKSRKRIARIEMVPCKDEEPVPRSTLDIPVLGLSTYRVRGERLITQAIDAALQFGYRLFDTAAHYNNERELGVALQELLPRHRLHRSDVYLISKLDPTCMTYEEAMESAECTLDNLQMDYIDVFLLHWPKTCRNDQGAAENAMLECYRALEDLHAAGKVKDIGVYKFGEDQLCHLLRRCTVSPAMLQAEFHPYLYQRGLVAICRANSIRMQAFCFIKVIEDPVIRELSAKYNKAPAQIILRWIVQHGVGVLPKSKTPSHIRENAEIFDFSLDDRDMEWINSLNRDQSYTPSSVYKV